MKSTILEFNDFKEVYRKVLGQENYFHSLSHNIVLFLPANKSSILLSSIHKFKKCY